jgi:hypothetical protein
MLLDAEKKNGCLPLSASNTKIATVCARAGSAQRWGLFHLRSKNAGRLKLLVRRSAKQWFTEDKRRYFNRRL